MIWLNSSLGQRITSQSLVPVPPARVIQTADGPMFDQEAWCEWLHAWCKATAEPGDYFDEKEAARAILFFERFLFFTKGRFAKRPFILLRWQRAMTACLFGWKRANGTRRFRQVALYIPRKNGKTEWGAGICHKCLLADGEYGAEVYSVANDKSQAAISLKVGKAMRAFSPEIMSRTQQFKYSLYAGATQSVWQVLSSETDNKDGLNTHCALFDEVHAMARPDLFDVIHTSRGARTQPLEVMTTTAGPDGPTFWNETLDHLLNILRGDARDRSILPILFSAEPANDEHVDHEDPAVWAMCNPSLGHTIRHDYYHDELKSIVGQPGKIKTFKRLYLNWRQSLVFRFLNMAHWSRCNLEPVALEDFFGREVWIGIDLSTTTDLTALALVAERPGGGLDLWVHHWMPAGRVEELTDLCKVPFALWREQGLITFSEGETIDYGSIIRMMVGTDDDVSTAIMKRCEVMQACIDRWNSSQVFADLMEADVPLVGFGQGYRDMSWPVKELQRLVNSHALNHGGNPLLSWQAGVMDVRQDDAEGLKPVKPNRQKASKRIDGLAAAIMAIGSYMRREQPERSIYEATG